MELISVMGCKGFGSGSSYLAILNNLCNSLMDGSSCALRRNVNAGLPRSETSVAEGNYTVNPEANGKNNNPIWILAVELLVPREGGGEEGRHEGRR